MVTTYPCSCCLKPVKRNQKALLCTGCRQWTHISCGHVSKKQYNVKSVLILNWQCPKCILQILPFWGEDLTNVNQLNVENKHNVLY